MNCQVRIISLGPSYAWADLGADRKCFCKLLIIFQLVSHLVWKRPTIEELPVDFCLLGLFGRFSAGRPSHVRPLAFSIILKVQTFHDASAHTRWWLCRIAIWDRNRIAMAIAICAWTTTLAFQVHSESTLSPQTNRSKKWKSHRSGFLHRRHTGEHLHPPARVR